MIAIFSGVALDSIKSLKAQMTWQVSSGANQIQEYFVLYKPASEKQIWTFKKTGTPRATLAPLQPSTDYDVRVVGYSSSGDVYASKVIRFTTKGKHVKF